MSNKESHNESQGQFHYFGSLLVVLILSFIVGLLSAPYIFKSKSQEAQSQISDTDFNEDSQADLENKSVDNTSNDPNSKNTSLKPPANTLSFKIKRDLIKQELNRYIVLLKQVGLTPFEDPKTGEPAGFMVTNIEKQSLFYKFGIRENDILKAVDNEPILEMNQAFVMFGKLTMNLESLKTVKLTIIRKNQTYTLNYFVVD